LLIVEGPVDFEDLAERGVVDEVALVVEDGRALGVPAGKQAPR
jgi:methyl coenzyme M reductase subunit C